MKTGKLYLVPNLAPSFFCKSLAANALALTWFFSKGVTSAKVNPLGSSNISSKPKPLFPLILVEIKPSRIPSPTIYSLPS